LFSTWSSFGY